MLGKRLGVLTHRVAGLHDELLIQRVLGLRALLCMFCRSTNVDTAHAIGSRIAIVDALAEGIGVDGGTKVFFCLHIDGIQWCSSQANLHRWREML